MHRLDWFYGSMLELKIVVKNKKPNCYVAQKLENVKR